VLGQPLVDLLGLDALRRPLLEVGSQDSQPPQDVPLVLVVRLRVRQDVVAEDLELQAGVPQVLGELFPDPALVRPLAEEVDGIRFSSDLLPSQLAVCVPKPDPPDPTSRYPFPDSPHLGFFLRSLSTCHTPP